MLAASHLSFGYRPHGHWVLKDVSLKVLPGEMVAVLGPNGAGKSTLAHIMCGLMLPSMGSISVNGEACQGKEGLRRLRIHTAGLLSPIENHLIGPTVREDILFGLQHRGFKRGEIERRLEEALRQWRLDSLADKPVEMLSSGERQRLGLASVLALQPAYLILDEPGLSLDYEMMEILYTRLAEHCQAGTGVLVMTSDLEEAARADHIVLLKEGQVIKEGRAGQIIADDYCLREVGLAVPLSVKVAKELEKWIDLGEVPGWPEGMAEVLCGLRLRS